MALNFPAKIYQILEHESADIIRWQPHGKAFRIIAPARFESEIIPKYFKHNQLASVQRQLNLYGFKCINRGDDKGAFFHPHFQRGHWGTAKKINRGPSRCNSSKKTVSSAVVTDEDSSSGSLMHELSSSAIPLRTIVTPSSVASHSAASSLNPLVSADPFLYVKQHLDVCQQQTYEVEALPRCQSMDPIAIDFLNWLHPKEEKKSSSVPCSNDIPLKPFGSSFDSFQDLLSPLQSSSVDMNIFEEPEVVTTIPSVQQELMSIPSVDVTKYAPLRVMIDPNLDLDFNLDVFQSEHFHFMPPAQFPFAPTIKPSYDNTSVVKPMMVDASVNTDITQVSVNINQLYRVCLPFHNF